MPQNLQNKRFEASNKLIGVVRMRMSIKLRASIFCVFLNFFGIGIGILGLIREIYLGNFTVEGFM